MNVGGASAIYYKATCPHSYFNDNNQLTICIIMIIIVNIVETLQTSNFVNSAHPNIPIWRPYIHYAWKMSVH